MNTSTLDYHVQPIADTNYKEIVINGTLIITKNDMVQTGNTYFTLNHYMEIEEYEQAEDDRMAKRLQSMGNYFYTIEEAEVYRDTFLFALEERKRNMQE